MSDEDRASDCGTGPAPFGLSPCGSQAEPLVPDAGTWEAGAIPIATTTGPKEIPGWINHPFGLDAPTLRGETVWVIHHLPTGYALAAIDGDVHMAVRGVDVLRGMGAWDFTDPAAAMAYRSALKLMREADVVAFNAAGVSRLASPNDAIADRSAKRQDPKGLGPKDESAGAKPIAQTGSETPA